MVEQWCVKVPAAQGETARQALIGEGTLDNALKVRREGTLLLLPVIGPREGAERCEFEPNPARPVLPRHDLVGGIAIMRTATGPVQN
jgi:tRNA (guanine37-N1)-methyltransferase